MRRNAKKPASAPGGRERDRGRRIETLARRAGGGDLEAARLLVRELEAAAGATPVEVFDKAVDQARKVMEQAEIVKVVAGYVGRSAFEDYAPDGQDRARREYYADVKGIADDLRERVRNGDIANRDRFYEALHEAVDGSQRVIYTAQAKEAVMVSDYAEEGIEEGRVEISSRSVRDGGFPWSQLAFCALERDIVEHLEQDGFDVNADDSFGGGEEADEEAEDSD